MDEAIANAARTDKREAAFARMRRRAPHLVPLFEAVRDHEVGLLLVPQVTRPLFRTLDTLRRPFIVILDDDTDRALGPGHFHGPSIERLIGMVDVAAVMSGAPCNDVYADMSALAAWSRQNVLMVETRVEQEDAWIETIWQVAPELRMVICTVMAGRPWL